MTRQFILIFFLLIVSGSLPAQARWKNYESIRDFSNGYAAVKMNGKCGFIDKEGVEVIPCKYDDVYDGFSKDGLAAMKLNDKWALIDKKGNELTPFLYEEVAKLSDC